MRLSKYIKVYIAFVSIITLLMATSMVVHAEVQGNGTAISAGRGGAASVAGGASQSKSGFLAYLTRENGELASEVYYIPYGSGASYSVDTMTARYTNNKEHQTYSGNMAEATNGQYKLPPFSFSGGTYGGSLKKWFITKGSDDTYGVVIFIKKVFRTSKEEFINNSLVLHVEAVAISRINSKNPNLQVAYTAYSIAKLREANIANDPQLNSFWMGRFQTCGMLQTDWAGLSTSASKTSNSSPYGVIQVRAKDLLDEPDEEPEEQIEAEGDDYIKANEINGMFTDLVPDSADMRKFNEYSSFVNGGEESFWKVVSGEHIRNEKLKDETWEILEEINSSIYDFYGSSIGHILRCSPADHDTFKDFDEEKIFEEDYGDVYPGYGYQYSRSMFGEDLVICDYRAIVEGYAGYESYFTDTLKMSWSHNISTGKTVGIGKEANTGDVKSDSYKFTAHSVEKYEEDEGHNEKVWIDDDSYEEGGYEDIERVYKWNEADVVDKEADNYSEPIEFEVTHTLYKYSAKNIETATLSSTGSLLYSNGVSNVASRVAWATQLPNIMKVIPEVAYRFYEPLLETSISSGDQMYGRMGREVYAMGEKIRSCLPAALHGYYVRIPSGAIIGNSLLDSPATGSDAKDLQNNWGATSRNTPLQVTVQGSGYSMITENAPIIELATVNLNFYDGNVGNINPNSEFGDMGGQASHESFVDTVRSSLVSKVTQKRFKTKTGGQLGDTYEMAYAEQAEQVNHHSPEHYWLRFENGSINSEDREAVINAIADAFGISTSEAAGLFGSWNLEGELQSMFETSAVTNAGGVKESPDRWYDEESIVLGVSVYKTTLKWGTLYLDDKVDYGDSVEGDKYNALNNGNQAVEAKFFYSLYYYDDVHSLGVDDSELGVDSVRYLVKDSLIKGTEFLISNSTTMGR